MKIVVLNGSPKGEESVTMQYVAYLRKKFPSHDYQILHVARDIRKIEKDEIVFHKIVDEVRGCDVVLWAFPLYFLLIPAQYKRFIELIFERHAEAAFSGKYAASLSTSIHFFDQTANNYLHGICDDLGMHFAGFYSAAMYDLLKEEEQARLSGFASLLFGTVQDALPVPREFAPVTANAWSYKPGDSPDPVDTGGKKVVILTDGNDLSGNLAKMTDRIMTRFSGSVERNNLHDLDIRGGCLGCCQCGYDNTCIYTDGFRNFYLNTLGEADIVIMAGKVHDRYLSSTWKQFFDRSFFKGHTPGLKGKQIAFVIEGPLQQLSTLREALAGWADNGTCNVIFITDECGDSVMLDALLDAAATRLARSADAGYVPPKTFYAVGGHKIFRDSIYGSMRLAFQADTRYYHEHGLFDFPQKDLQTRLFNTVLIPMTRIPAFRKKLFADIKRHMVRPFRAVLDSA